MLIVAGHLLVEPADRQGYLDAYVEVVEQARRTPGCLDFTVAADLVDPSRINIFERWQTRAAVEAFRGEGQSDEQSAAITFADVAEFDVGAATQLS